VTRVGVQVAGTRWKLDQASSRRRRHLAIGYFARRSLGEFSAAVDVPYVIHCDDEVLKNSIERRGST
jgi:hypothetical protein